MTDDSAQLPLAPTAGADHVQRDHLRKEGWTMALYVAICLFGLVVLALAILIALLKHALATH